MSWRKIQAIPARLEAGRRRFERWRRTRRGHSRIPEPPWTSAAKLAGAYGLCRTARTFGLDYNARKRRVASADPHNSPGGKAAAQKTGTAFVELVTPQPAGLPECLVELERPDGAKMRIHLKSVEAPDLAAMSRSFWGLEA